MRWTQKPYVTVAAAVLLAVGITCWLVVRQRDAVPPPNPEPEPPKPQAEKPKTEPPAPDKLPASWKLDEIAKGAPPYGLGTEGVYVLAWQTWWDGQPPQGGSCLVMRVLEEDDGYGGRWHLSHLYQRSDKDPKWRISTAHITEGKELWQSRWVFHSKRFRNRPTNNDLYAALTDHRDGVPWSFALEPDSTVVDCGVCEQNWLKVTGEKPTQFFNQYAVDPWARSLRLIAFFASLTLYLPTPHSDG